MVRISLPYIAKPHVYTKYMGWALILIINTVNLQGQKPYPDWFLHPQKYPELLIGFSFAKITTADEDAIWRYSYQENGFLYGTASYFNGEDKWEKKYVTEALVPFISPDQIKIIDRIITSPYNGGEEIALFKKSSNDNSYDRIFSLDYPSSSSPEWVKKAPFFVNGPNLFGVGRYVLKGNENDAWRTAEERALVEIASAIGLGVENHSITSEYYSEKDSGLSSRERSKILTYSFDHEFRSISVLERWIDYNKLEQDGYASIYVLMKISKNNIKENLSSE